MYTTLPTTFIDYVNQTRELIAKARQDLSPQQRELFVETNSPFEWQPDIPLSSTGKFPRGILLIHGLSDSPYSMQDMGRHFLEQGFLVRAVLLPGHGTLPHDLLRVHPQEWLDVVGFGVATLVKDVDKVYVCGFSLGAAIAVQQVLFNDQVHKLILLAPALKPKHRLAFASGWHKIAGWFYRKIIWHKRNRQKSYAKYESVPSHATHEARLLMQRTYHLLQKKILTIPVFMVVSENDETIDVNAVMKIFAQNPHPNSRLLLYTNSRHRYFDPRIIVHKSAYPELDIIDFSHVAISNAPNNSHYGIHGDYQDFQHYYNNAPPHSGTVYLGAITKQNITNYTMQRLTFNPDFNGMLQLIDQFLL